jgi:hypothetical protein
MMPHRILLLLLLFLLLAAASAQESRQPGLWQRSKTSIAVLVVCSVKQ